VRSWPNSISRCWHFLAVVAATGCLSLRPMFLRYTGGDPQEALDDDGRWRSSISDFFLRAVRA
jgi:hypothetical protein